MHFTFSESIDYIIDDLREELSYTNFTIYNQKMQHQEMSLVGWEFYFEPRGDAKTLRERLVPVVKKIVKFDLVFVFKARRIFNGTTEPARHKKYIIKKRMTVKCLYI